MHAKTKLAHLNITSSSVMIQNQSEPWDNLRLTEFDFAQHGSNPSGRQLDT